jgi:hypothetical protein
MPVHDWTKARPGTFHDFHGSWITHRKETLNGGLLLIDLFPPGPHDRQGIHEAVWAKVDGIEAGACRQPPGQPLTLVAYEAKHFPTSRHGTASPNAGAA